MKKAIVFLLASMMVLSLFGCKKEEPAVVAPEEKKTFTVGFDQEFPPYGFVNDAGQFDGFDIDMAKEAASRMGYEIVLQPIDWNAKDFELSSGTIDCIWNGFTMNGREELYTWTQAYMDNSIVFVVPKDSNVVDFAGLAGKIVTTQLDSSAETALNSEDMAELKGSFSEFLTCADYNTAFMDLESGAVDAVAVDIGVAKFQLTGKEDKFVILEEPLVSEQYGVGFLLGNTELRDKVEATLVEMVNDGTFAQISEKWFGYDVGIIGK